MLRFRCSSKPRVFRNGNKQRVRVLVDACSAGSVEMEDDEYIRRIIIRGVCFSYPSHPDVVILYNIDLYAPANKAVGTEGR